MSRRLRFGFILAHNRQDMLDACLTAIRPQVDSVLVIDNASSPALQVPQGRLVSDEIGLPLLDVHLLQIPDQPPNIALFWNIAFDFFAKMSHDRQDGLFYSWDAAMLCDDTAPPAGWFETVVAAMRATGAVAGCTDPFARQFPPRVKTRPDNDIMGRMSGHAWIVDGDQGFRADERLAWWWQDTDADFSMRLAGGMVMIGIPALAVPNIRPNDFTVQKPELAHRAGLDGQVFAAKWGFRPW